MYVPPAPLGERPDGAVGGLGRFARGGHELVQTGEVLGDRQRPAEVAGGDARAICTQRRSIHYFNPRGIKEKPAKNKVRLNLLLN